MKNVRRSVTLIALLVPGISPASAQTVIPPSIAECWAGQVLLPGEACRYPGTEVEFRDGGGGVYEWYSPGPIDWSDGKLNSSDYDFAATHVSHGAWRIDRVHGYGSAPYGGGLPGARNGTDTSLSWTDPRCMGTRHVADGEFVRIDVIVEGEIHANAHTSSVLIEARANGDLIDVKPVGRLAAGDVARFAAQGAIFPDTTSLTCAVDIEYFDIASLRRGEPVRVKQPGRLVR